MDKVEPLVLTLYVLKHNIQDGILLLKHMLMVRPLVIKQVLVHNSGKLKVLNKLMTKLKLN